MGQQIIGAGISAVTDKNGNGNGSQSNASQAKTNPRTLIAIRDIYRGNGVSGLFAGLIPRLAKVAPACAIMIASFEYGKSFFYSHNVNVYSKGNFNTTNKVAL